MKGLPNQNQIKKMGHYSSEHSVDGIQDSDFPDSASVSVNEEGVDVTTIHSRNGINKSNQPNNPVLISGFDKAIQKIKGGNVHPRRTRVLTVEEEDRKIKRKIINSKTKNSKRKR